MKGLEKAVEILTYDASAETRLSFIRGVSPGIEDFLKLAAISLASSSSIGTYAKLTKFAVISKRDESVSKAIKSVAELLNDYKTPRKISQKADTILKLLVAPWLLSIRRPKLRRTFLDMGIDSICPIVACRYFGFNENTLLVKTKESYKNCAHCRKPKVNLYENLLCAECIKVIKRHVEYKSIPFSFSIFNSIVSEKTTVENHLTFPYKFTVDSNYITVNYVEHPYYQARLPFED